VQQTKLAVGQLLAHVVCTAYLSYHIASNMFIFHSKSIFHTGNVADEK